MTPKEAAAALEGIGQALEAGLDEGALLEVGHFALAMVLLRTKQGLDVDGKPFEPYSEPYAEERVAHGLARQPVDLARTGAMLGAFQPVLEDGGVSVRCMNEHEAIKAIAHDRGVDKQVTVHRRAAAKPSGKVKLAAGSYQRHMRLPKREVWDVRRPEELAAIAEVAGEKLQVLVEKKR